MVQDPAKSLGELQAAVLSALWDSGEALSVRNVMVLVKRNPPLAYTTVLTVLSRLYEQDVVVRKKDGKAYLYSPRVSREQWIGDRAARELLASGGPPDQAVLVTFLDSAERADPALLDRLSTLIEKRKKRRPR